MRNAYMNFRRHTMNLNTSWALVLALGLALAACQSTRPDRDWVQTNIVDKDLFQGEWHYARTVVDNDHDDRVREEQARNHGEEQASKVVAR